MNKPHILLSAAALCLLCTLLPGCWQSSSPSPTKDTGQPSVQTAPQTPSDKVEAPPSGSTEDTDATVSEQQTPPAADTGVEETWSGQTQPDKPGQTSTPDASKPEGTTEPEETTDPEQSTAPDLSDQETDSDKEPTDPPDQETDSGKELTDLTYAQYISLPAEDQQAYYQAFENDEDFFTWYRAAKAVFDAQQSDNTLTGDSAIDISDYINGK